MKRFRSRFFAFVRTSSAWCRMVRSLKGVVLGVERPRPGLSMEMSCRLAARSFCESIAASRREDG